jgi:NlpC/P60 family putative phage cell wall peptidase
MEEAVMAIDADAVIAAARGWIGTPYVHQASVRGAACDCLGLLRGVWRELAGAEPETPPPYSGDWAECSGEETMRAGFARHFRAVEKRAIVPGDILLFRMIARGPAKHCGVLASQGGMPTLIHARQNKRVSEEHFSRLWRGKLAFAFRV